MTKYEGRDDHQDPAASRLTAERKLHASSREEQRGKHCDRHRNR